MKWILLVVLIGLGIWGYQMLKGNSSKPRARPNAQPIKTNSQASHPETEFRDSTSSNGSTPSPVTLPPSDFEAVAQETEWFVNPLPNWIVKAAKQHLDASDNGQKQSVVAIRNTGEALSKEEKHELGVRANAKLGRDYIDALSNKGKKENPLRALELVLLRCNARRSRERTLKNAAELGPNIELEISPANDQRDCNEVGQYQGHTYRLNEVPALPLGGCDVEHCRCIYIVKPEF